MSRPQRYDMDMTDTWVPAMVRDVARLLAECDAYREALEEVAKIYECCSICRPRCEDWHACPGRIARKALAARP